MIIKSKSNEFEKLEVLKEFMETFMNYLRYNESTINEYKILYDLKDIEGILDSMFQLAIINEYEFSDLDEEDIQNEINRILKMYL